MNAANGMTPICEAAKHGNLEVINVLLSQHRPPADLIDSTGQGHMDPWQVRLPVIEAHMLSLVVSQWAQKGLNDIKTTGESAKDMKARWKECVARLKLEYTERDLEMKPYAGMKGTKDTEDEPFSPTSIANRESLTGSSGPAC